MIDAVIAGAGPDRPDSGMPIQAWLESGRTCCEFFVADVRIGSVSDRRHRSFSSTGGKLEPRVAVITGASRGIGAATARVLAERGFRVVVNYRSSAKEADEVVADIAAAGGEAVAIQADVTVPDDVAAMTGETEQRWGRVDVLVHNALIPYDITSFADLSWEQLGGKLDRELHAAFLLTKAVVPGMTSRGYGRLLYLTAEPSRHPRNGMINLGVRQGGHGSVRPLHRT